MRLTRIIASVYRDSVALMQLSATVGERPGVRQASVVMATEANLELLRNTGLLEGAVNARASDLLVVVDAASERAGKAALDAAEAGLAKAPGAAASGPTVAARPRSLAMAHAAAPHANLALISVPGPFAAAEADKALAAGLNVMLFSDNVSIEDEIRLKARAAKAGRLLMGPDCGTAIIDGVPLGFANVVKRGGVGCIGASGTGLQQVTSLVSRMGAGVSQAIGTGGRDVSDAVGGVMTLQALKLLARDPDTKVIAIIGKPPGAKVAAKLYAAASKAGKPVVMCLLGAAPMQVKNVFCAATLEAAAQAADALANRRRPGQVGRNTRLPKRPAFGAADRYVRGLFSGGTFAYEAALVLEASLGKVWTNDTLADRWKSREHTVIDLGDDEFTRGRPHPMIDQRLRNERIAREAASKDVAVILLDCVLGHGAHPDPAGAMVPAIRAACAKRKSLVFVSSVCGTGEDPQNLDRQQRALQEAGVIVAGSNAEAARVAARLLTRK